MTDITSAETDAPDEDIPERVTHFNPVLWESMTDEDHVAAGHVKIRVADPDGSTREWTWAHSWTENPTGSLSLRRVVYLDFDHPVVTVFATYASGKWDSVESQGHSYDLEAIYDQEDAQREAEYQEAQSAEAARARMQLAGAGALPSPNRAARRNGPR